MANETENLMKIFKSGINIANTICGGIGIKSQQRVPTAI